MGTSLWRTLGVAGAFTFLPPGEDYQKGRVLRSMELVTRAYEAAKVGKFEAVQELESEVDPDDTRTLCYLQAFRMWDFDYLQLQSLRWRCEPFLAKDTLKQLTEKISYMLLYSGSLDKAFKRDPEESLEEAMKRTPEEDKQKILGCHLFAQEADFLPKEQLDRLLYECRRIMSEPLYMSLIGRMVKLEKDISERQ